IYFTYLSFSPYFFPDQNKDLWITEQLYAGPLDWLTHNQKDPAVVWSDPHDYLATMVPVLTNDFTLYDYWGMLELLPESEVRERYLVSQYFNNPSVDTLKSDSEIN